MEQILSVNSSQLFNFKVDKRDNDVAIIFTHSSSTFRHSLRSKTSIEGQFVTSALIPSNVNFNKNRKCDMSKQSEKELITC